MLMLSDFKTSTHGKWILTGEHAVLRGHSALVFPIKSHALTLIYRGTETTLHAEYTGERFTALQDLFWRVLEHGMAVLDLPFHALKGHFSLQSTIPIGVGMGASAALCVATARWFLAQQLIKADELQSFATSLENLFHGKSSGLDIAGVSADRGVAFKQGESRPIELAWQPIWYLSSSTEVGITSDCLSQVESLWKRAPKLAQRIDEQMDQSALLAFAALQSHTLDNLTQLATAIDLAHDCFHQWGLISEPLAEHMALLQKSGALAVKPTGSGHGGFVLSLWREPPKDSERLGLLAI